MLDRQDLSNLSKKIAAHIVGSGLSLRSDSNDALVALTCEETTPDSRWSDVNASFSLDKDGHWNTDA
jgi:hypothetical protein